MQDLIEFRGSYQYANMALLETALTAAREQLESNAFEADVEWPDCFSQDGTTLYVHAMLPPTVNGYFSNAILRALAETAVKGAVEARKGGQAHEY